MRRILMLMITMLTLGSAVVVANPASAAPASTEQIVTVDAWWDCPEGRFCAWYDTNGYGEPRYRGTERAPDLREFKLNDHVHSVWNRTGEVWCAFPDINSTDINGSAAPNPWPIGNWQGNTSQYRMQDVISSLRRGAC